MLSDLTGPQRQAVVAIAKSIAPIETQAFDALLTAMRYQALHAQDQLLAMGQPNNSEYFVLDGILRSYVLSPDGNEVTLNFFEGPCILSPSIARSVEGLSQINCEALKASAIVHMHNDDLVRTMVSNAGMQRWGDAVMRRELVQRTQREIALVASSAKQRLSQFRNEFSGLEDSIPHHLIASYIGITPVTLSRLRKD